MTVFFDFFGDGGGEGAGAGVHGVDGVVVAGADDGAEGDATDDEVGDGGDAISVGDVSVGGSITVSVGDGVVGVDEVVVTDGTVEDGDSGRVASPSMSSSGDATGSELWEISLLGVTTSSSPSVSSSESVNLKHF